MLHPNILAESRFQEFAVGMAVLSHQSLLVNK